MRAGQLHHRVAFDAPVDSQDEAGGVTTGWSVTPIVVWGAVEPLTGRELLLAGELASSMDTRIRVRWSPALAAMTPKWRAREGGRTYDVVSVADVRTAHREIEIMARSGLNNG